MYLEDDLLPISALQHLLFCERQCALIHVERMWAENRLTAEGRFLHRKAHAAPPETRDGVRITRGLPLHNFEFGLTGQADVIEWEIPEHQRRLGISLAKLLQKASPKDKQSWRVTPVEYKRGQPKSNDCDRVQLCAQALCLEEMLQISIPDGALYYGRNRRRTAVLFDVKLRKITSVAALRLHEIFDRRLTPPAIYDSKCESCSLKEFCLPAATTAQSSVWEWIDRQLD